MKNKITIILGKKGQGKTTKAKELIKGRERLIILDTLGEYQEEPIQLENLTTLKIYLSQKTPFRFRIAYKYEEEDIEDIFSVLYKIEQYTLVLEEVDNYSSANFCPVDLRKIIRYGRHKGINVIATSRRPASVNRLLSSQADDMYIYRFTEPRDITYIRELTNKETSEKVKSLPDHKSIYLTL